ncbi:MAG TPA: type 1 glutamine amidotransferase domain-containing protein [Vicinamibacterales bacterium]|nr:type 1 glutamine amidotransferase domain-containing protein [Vicinamibacterales bacterium]
MKRILMVVSSRERLGDTGTPTGAWLEELAASYWVFEDAGCDVTVASPRGGRAPLDPLSLSEPWLTANGQRFLADEPANRKLERSVALADVNGADFAAVYLVGGVATAWDFPGNATLASIVGAMYRDARPVGAVCHGVLGLTGARDDEGQPIVAGRAVTGVSNAEEVATGFDKIVPVLPEDRLTTLGGRYSCAPPFEAHVCADGNLFTGQNPASAGPLAKAMLARLDAPG